MKKFRVAVSTAVATAVMCLACAPGAAAAPETGQSSTRGILCRIIPC